MTTLAERWFEEGKEKGIEKGRLETLQRLVRRQLELKFGGVDAATERTLTLADEATLERCAERLLTATRIDEVIPPR